MSATMDRDTTTEVPAAPGSVGGEAPTIRSGRRWWWLVVVVAVVVAAAVVAVIVLTNGEATEDADAAATRNFADVVQVDLVEVETYDATLGTVEGDPITTQLAGTVTAAATTGGTVQPGDVLFAVDGNPVVLLDGAEPAYRDLGPTEDTVTLSARTIGTVTAIVEDGATLGQGDVLYRVDGAPVVVLYGEVPAYRALRDVSDNLEGDDVRQLETALDALGYNDAGMTVDEEFTGATEDVVENWQDDIGAEVDGSVDLGEVIFVPGPVTVIDTQLTAGEVVTDGRVIAIVTGTTPTEGEDVRQLEANLASLGYDADGALVVDGVFDEATTTAVTAWQADVGMDVDGIIELGEVVFLPDPIQVSDRLATPGSSVAPGAPVLAAASAEKVVTLELPAGDQELVAVGDAVTVELPDGSDVAGTVVEVATVATVTATGETAFEVTIELDDPAAAGNLDEAPVEVDIVTDSVSGVKAVPVTALLALAEGGYAVEVARPGDTTELVAVDPGFFADGMVEITATGVDVGDRVVVP